MPVEAMVLYMVFIVVAEEVSHFCIIVDGGKIMLSLWKHRRV